MLAKQKIETSNKNTDTIQIDSKLLQTNTGWVAEQTQDFLETTGLNGMRLFFEPQPVPGKTVRSLAKADSQIGEITAYGEGRDEYEATTKLLENLELELRILQTQQPTIENIGSFLKTSASRLSS